MKKIYIVRVVDYDDYGIDLITANKEDVIKKLKELKEQAPDTFDSYYIDVTDIDKTTSEKDFVHYGAQHFLDREEVQKLTKIQIIDLLKDIATKIVDYEKQLESNIANGITKNGRIKYELDELKIRYHDYTTFL